MIKNERQYRITKARGGEVRGFPKKLEPHSPRRDRSGHPRRPEVGTREPAPGPEARGRGIRGTAVRPADRFLK